MINTLTKKYSIFILIILHAAGIIGISSPYKDLFLSLSAINLLITTYLLFINYKNELKSILPYLILVAVLGFILEVIGVKTGKIFGEYFYGNSLGVKLLDVPIIIGLNWLNLSFICTVVASELFGTEKYNFRVSLLAAMLMVFLDFFMEKVCYKCDFWYWKHFDVPAQNFVAWFFISFLFSSILQNKTKSCDVNFSRFVYIIQFVFFFALNLLS